MLRDDLSKLAARRRLLYAGLGLLLAVGILVVACRAQEGRRAEAALMASGVLHAREIRVASELGGRVAAVHVDEGEIVAAGEPLVQLDTRRLDAEIEAAEATVALAEAGLAQARAGARPGEIAVAEAQLAQAEAAWMMARQAVTDTQALVANPQELALEIAVTQAQLTAAEHRVSAAVAVKDQAEFGKQQAAAVVAEWGEGGRHRVRVDPEEVLGELPEELRELLPDVPDVDLDNGTYTFKDWELEVRDGECSLYRWLHVSVPDQAHLAPLLWWQSWINLNATSAQREGLEGTLADLYARRANPQSYTRARDEARSQAAAFAAQVAMAEAQVAGLRAGVTPEELAALEARRDQALAGRDALRQQRAMLELTAPEAGTVVELVTYLGEVAAQGAPILILAELSELTLTLYVPQERLGEVYPGQRVAVRVDAFPGREFEGRVEHIAAEAEFTPRNVATWEERTTLVYAVEVRVPNPEGLLKRGMPADGVFELGEGR